MIIEFFGLSNTGKSVFKKNLEKKGYNVSKTENISKTKDEEKSQAIIQ